MDKTTDNTFDPLAWGTKTQETRNAPTATSQSLNTPKASQPLTPADELALAKAVTRELIARGANIAESYDDFSRLGFALANGLGAEGRDIYHTLCAHSTKYRPADCERKWQQCLRQADGRTSIATFYHMARQAGVEIRNIRK